MECSDIESEYNPSGDNGERLSQQMQDDPDLFASGLSLGTQIIAEVNKIVEEGNDNSDSQLRLKI